MRVIGTLSAQLGYKRIVHVHSGNTLGTSSICLVGLVQFSKK